MKLRLLAAYWCLVLLLLASCKGSPKLIWKTPTDGPIYGSPAIAENLVFIGSDDKYLYALNTTDGAIRWKKMLSGKIVATPVVLNDLLYIGSGGGEFYSLKPETGETKWTIKTAALIHYQPCSDKSGLYFGNDKGEFFKVDYTGRIVWQLKAGNKFWGHCIFYRDLVLTTSWDNNLYAIEKDNGTVKWKVSSGTLNFGPPELAADDVYFATHEKLYRIEAATGKILSNTKTLYLNNVVFAKQHLWTNEKGLSKRNLDGKVIGSVEFNSFTDFRPLFTGSYFVISGDSKKLYGVSDDLKILWTFKGEDTFWSPGVIKNNVYYTGNRDNNVYAIRLPQN